MQHPFLGRKKEPLSQTLPGRFSLMISPGSTTFRADRSDGGGPQWQLRLCGSAEWGEPFVVNVACKQFVDESIVVVVVIVVAVRGGVARVKALGLGFSLPHC